MSDYELRDEMTFQKLLERCMEIHKEGFQTNVSEIAVELMDMKEVPMHYPFHHFIVPAAMLTAAAVAKEDKKEHVKEMLQEALERAKCVVGGSCGNMGSCGAAVGAGIFMSVYTDSSPMSKTTWSWCNDLTGCCLQTLARVEGPRCCKRTTFMVIQEAVPYANEKLDLNLEHNRKQECKYHRKNADCKKTQCPFYPT